MAALNVLKTVPFLFFIPIPQEIFIYWNIKNNKRKRNSKLTHGPIYLFISIQIFMWKYFPQQYC